MPRSSRVTVSTLTLLTEVVWLTLVTVTTGKVITAEELEKVHGRAWEDVDVSTEHGWVGISERKLTSTIALEQAIAHKGKSCYILFSPMPLSR